MYYRLTFFLVVFFSYFLYLKNDINKREAFILDFNKYSLEIINNAENQFQNKTIPICKKTSLLIANEGVVSQMINYKYGGNEYYRNKTLNLNVNDKFCLEKANEKLFKEKYELNKNAKEQIINKEIKLIKNDNCKLNGIILFDNLYIIKQKNKYFICKN